MKTITFYSYKGGAGRSLALANAARYLVRLGFSVVALDFDLEAPGLHYKFSPNSDGKALPLRVGVVDYIHSFVVDGLIPDRIKDFSITVEVPGTGKPRVELIGAGNVPSRDYWLKLSTINWHELFYSSGASGVKVFLELKSRIQHDLNPDFLLIDSRTGITEMGGVATTLLADQVICFVLPMPENLEGARAVLRSLKRSQRDAGSADLEVIIALSRLPYMKDQEVESSTIDRILNSLNEEAEDLRDTLSCREVFILHSEAQLQLREELRIGGNVSPDDSILLRDYLRLFAKIVPKELIQPKLGQLIQRAKDRIWSDPEGALKEVEELAESFGHPENYRALLNFYEVRSVSGTSVLRRAQRLWELTRDPSDPTLWRALLLSFEPKPHWRLSPNEWSPNLNFVEDVWRTSGQKDPDFAVKLASAYSFADEESRAADILLEAMENREPSGKLAAPCVLYLDIGGRQAEADALTTRLAPALGGDPGFVDAWADHAVRSSSPRLATDLVNHPSMKALKDRRPVVAARLFVIAGMREEALSLAEAAVRGVLSQEPSLRNVSEAMDLFHDLGMISEFTERVRGAVPAELLREAENRLRRKRRT